MCETKTEWFIIVNPRAGSGKTISGWTVAERLLRELGVPFTCAFTHYKSHARELACQAARDGYRRFVAAGGDGSVHEMFSGVLDFCTETGTPADGFLMGNIPIGSGNDWLKSLGVPHDIERVVRLIAEGSSRMQDVISVHASDGRTCCMSNVGGTGFDSHVCERVNARKERGHRSRWIYVGALVMTILKLRRIRLEVSGDGQVLYSGPCYSLALGNGRFSGGGMLQTADAAFDDGLVDVLVVPAMSLLRIIREIHRLFDGTTPQSSALVYRQCKHLSIRPLDSRSADFIEVDGEIEGRLPVEVSVTGQRIGVVAPRA
ncbi:MAG: diacylglycerol kinase family lipid kinase [Bacteroidales bacterium]|nr:diacylglycerol kinase family lipid kinase [Bacteroidales bacterium]